MISLHKIFTKSINPYTLPLVQAKSLFHLIVLKYKVKIDANNGRLYYRSNYRGSGWTLVDTNTINYCSTEFDAKASYRPEYYISVKELYTFVGRHLVT